MTFSAYAGFVGVAFVLAVTPGPDTFLALRFALLGRRPGALAASGTSLAILAWAALAAVGVAAVLSASPTAYGTLTALGGVYLFFLGVRALQAVRSATAAATPTSGGGSDIQPGEGGKASGGRGAFVAGVTTCLTNPKTGLFFLALFPQFVAPGVNALYATLVLGGTVAIVVYSYLLGLVVAADVARGWLTRPRVANAIEGASGAVLAGLGAYMILKAASTFFA